MKVNPIPNGYHAITPYLYIRGAAKALEFYKKAFGAEEIMRMPMPDGRLGHAEIRFGDSVIMLADENLEMNVRSPQSVGGTSVGLAFYCNDVDTVYHRALQNGATSERGPKDQFYGDRSATVIDPFGHRWTIATHIEDVSPEEMTRRMKAQKPA
jgi:PhnB protein